MTPNQFTVGMEDVGAPMLEFFKNAQPGSRIKITLDNGVSTLGGELIVDENTSDRVAARVKLEGGQSLGGCEGMEDDEAEDAPPAEAPKTGTGASVMAALGLGGKKG